MRSRTIVEWVVIGACAGCIAACSSDAKIREEGYQQAAAAILAEGQPVNEIFTYHLAHGKIVNFSRRPLPPNALKIDDSPRKSDPPPRPPIYPKLSKKLLGALSDARSRGEVSKEVEVLITFTEDFQIPRFPQPQEKEPRTSPTNQAWLQRSRVLVQNIVSQRARGHAIRDLELFKLYNAKVTEHFWLINGVVAQLPISEIDRIAARADVEYIEPRQTDTPPPKTVRDARVAMNTDPFFNLGLTGGWVGLLDTGVRSTHVLFNNPRHVDYLRDCVNGGTDCNTGSNLDPNDCWPHGTSSAAIITGNANLGEDYRGVTPMLLDSWKVYDCSQGMDSAAAVRGFQAAVAAGDRVIVAEIQAGESETGAIATAADAAYNAGAVVIAAAGNNGPTAGSVTSPGNAHRALAVGAWDLLSSSVPSYSGRGPTADGRYKPDILAPTNIETATNTSDTALTAFGGTSCGTSLGAGAATLVRNFLRTGFEIDAGAVYSYMIMTGGRASFDNTSGTGLVKIPQFGQTGIGRFVVMNGTMIEIPFTVDSVSQIDAAIWWPEIPSIHNDVDLRLVAPNGSVVESSVSRVSVFEKLRATTTTIGNWKLRINGYSVTGSTNVYCAFFAKY